MKKILTVLLFLPCLAFAAVDLDITTPAIVKITASMKNRHIQKLSTYLDSGAVGLTHDGLIAVRDVTLVRIQERSLLNALVAEENNDRNTIYKEIAAANGHPEWENEIHNSFAQRWIKNAQSGWWYQDAGGAWVKK